MASENRNLVLKELVDQLSSHQLMQERKRCSEAKSTEGMQSVMPSDRDKRKARKQARKSQRQARRKQQKKGKRNGRHSLVLQLCPNFVV